MPVVSFTLSEEGVTALRDALTCLNKFSDDVSLEAKKDRVLLTALNSSKSAYACFSFNANRFFSRYLFDSTGQHRDKFYCTLYSRALISIFRSRSGGDPQRDRERESTIEKCDVSIEDNGPHNRFIAKLVFRNGVTSTHKLPFEQALPVHGKFDRDEAIHHWTIPSRTLRQLMDHFGPGVELIDINADGEHVNFTCFSEKTIGGEDALKKPLQTSIAVEVDEFEDIDVEDKLHIIVSVKDLRAIILHAGATGNDLSARYSMPARPIQLSYHGDGISCEFLLMTVGERGNPGQKTRKGRANGTKTPRPELEAASYRPSVAPPEQPQAPEHQTPAPVVSQPLPARQGLPLKSNFSLRPSQRPPPPPPALLSEGLFVENDKEWEPVRDEEEEEEEARLEWDSTNHNDANMPMSMRILQHPDPVSDPNWMPASAGIDGLEPTQRLSDVRRLGLFYEGP